MDLKKLISTLFVCLSLVMSGCANIGTTAKKPEMLVETKLLASVKDYNTLRTHILNVGNGNCVILEAPKASHLLIADCGSVSSNSAMNRDAVKQYIGNIVSQYPQGITISVIISHADKDHYNYLPFVINGREPYQVFLGGAVPFNGVADCFSYGNYNETKNWLNKYSKKVVFNFTGQTVMIGDAAVYFLANNTGVDLTKKECVPDKLKNTASAVAKVAYSNKSILLTGDATDPALTASYVNNGNNLQTNILVSPHHGATTDGSNSSWFSAVNRPELIVYSAGSHAGYKHPRCDSYRNFEFLVSPNAPNHCVTCSETYGPLKGQRRFFATNKAEYSTQTNGSFVVDITNMQMSLHPQFLNKNNYCN